MRLKFDEQLDLLNKELITMGAFCENAIAMSAKALTEGNPALANTVPRSLCSDRPQGARN